MEHVRIMRIVVASPSDVKAERDSISSVVEELNRGVAADHGFRLELSRWETDTYPGFHANGPQGLIDPVLRIEDCDLLIGIFWKRFGTPIKDGQSGTEHEIRRAYATWKQYKRPQIMVYFNQEAYTPKSKEEADQWGQVLGFRSNFPKEGLWWEYNGKADFEFLIRNHLTQFIRNYSTSSQSSQTKRRSSDEEIKKLSQSKDSDLYVVINTITATIRDSVELDTILQTTVNEVVRALNAQSSALYLQGEDGKQVQTFFYFGNGAESFNANEEAELTQELDAYGRRFAGSLKNYVLNGGGSEQQSQSIRPLVVVPLTYQGRFMGALVVRSDDPTRVWQKSELNLLQTGA